MELIIEEVIGHLVVLLCMTAGLILESSNMLGSAWVDSLSGSGEVREGSALVMRDGRSVTCTFSHRFTSVVC